MNPYDVIGRNPAAFAVGEYQTLHQQPAANPGKPVRWLELFAKPIALPGGIIPFVELSIALDNA